MAIRILEVLKPLINPLLTEDQRIALRARRHQDILWAKRTGKVEQGRGWSKPTKHYAHESKARRKMAATSRKINRGKRW